MTCTLAHILAIEHLQQASNIMNAEQTNENHVNGTSTNGVSTNGMTKGTVSGNGADSHYVIPNRGHSDPDNIRVICVGAGFSGVCLAYKLQQTVTNYELVCYEKYVGNNYVPWRVELLADGNSRNDNVGGTWYENKYPGVGFPYSIHF